jgi:hypothetical protein
VVGGQGRAEGGDKERKAQGKERKGKKRKGKRQDRGQFFAK